MWHGGDLVVLEHLGQRRHGDRPAAPHREHEATAVAESPRRVEDLQRPAAQRNAVLPLRLHPHGRHGPHAPGRVHLLPSGEPDLPRPSGREHERLERQLDGGLPGLRRSHGLDSGAESEFAASADGPDSTNRTRSTALPSTYFIGILADGAERRLGINVPLDDGDSQSAPVLSPGPEPALAQQAVTPGKRLSASGSQLGDRVVPIPDGYPLPTGSLPQIPAQVGLELGNLDGLHDHTLGPPWP